MRRREFITLLGGAAAAWPMAAWAQQSRMPVVASSSQSQESEAAVLASWRQALNESGYVGGRNVEFEYRFADGQLDRLTIWPPNWFAAGDGARRKHHASGFCGQGSDYHDSGRIRNRGRFRRAGQPQSFNRPGANVTGVTFLSNKLVAKRLELSASPASRNAPIGMSAHAHNPNTVTDVRDALATAAALGRMLQVQRIAKVSDLIPPLTRWSSKV